MNRVHTTEFVSFPTSQRYESTDPVTLHRGIYRQAYTFLYAPGDTYYDCESHAEFCAQSTLTPLSPSGRKTFQILF